MLYLVNKNFKIVFINKKGKKGCNDWTDRESQPKNEKLKWHILVTLGKDDVDAMII